jgi:NAD(P)-dependent dehydrogenase (short-subunit alcohol dehydrogenase family)
MVVYKLSSRGVNRQVNKIQDSYSFICTLVRKTNMSSNPHTILVTGAHREIGLAILHSLALALPFSTLLLGCRSIPYGEAAISDLRAQGVTSIITPVRLDVTDDDSVRSAVAFVANHYGRLDVLVNNAGCAVIPPDPEIDSQGYRAAFQSVYNVSATSVALCTALFLPLLRKSSDGRVINVSSGRASM